MKTYLWLCLALLLGMQALIMLGIWRTNTEVDNARYRMRTATSQDLKLRWKAVYMLNMQTLDNLLKTQKLLLLATLAVLAGLAYYQ